MRDIGRIEEFTNKLAEIWKDECPDWRFGQLMLNFLGSAKTDPFFWEEDRFIQELVDWFDNLRG